MKTGTCYFPTYGAAMRYYRPYLGDTYTRGAQFKELRQLVDSKLNSREIHIGKPPLREGQALSIEDNRYHITEGCK